MLTHTEVDTNGVSRQLVVMAHPYTGSPASLADLRKVIRAQLPDADLFIPQYDAGALANSDPFDIANQFEVFIGEHLEDRAMRGKTYDEIILIGVSVGALLIRKAYVFGMGGAEDHPTLPHKPPSAWVDKVSRIILLAGMNRGWEINPRPRRMPLWRKLQFQLGILVSRVLPVGRFILAMRRGSPFVANLRVQWLRMAVDDKLKVAPVIQILGDIDDLVTADDSMDLVASRNFIFMQALNTRHGNIRRFDASVYGQERKELFEEALTSPPAALTQKYGPTPEQVDRVLDRVEQIIFVVHGIRDTGQWVGDLVEAIMQQADSRQINVRVWPSKYVYFPMLLFLLPGARQRHVRWFMDRYTEALAVAGSSNVQVNFIGHSNGTYILAKALETYATLRVHNVAFAGSVVPRDYNWADKQARKRVALVRNDLGAADWVVAIFPRFFELLKELSGVRAAVLQEVGSGGFNGFQDIGGNQYEAIYRGAHGAAITARNFASLADFALTGVIERPPDLLVERQSPLVTYLSRLCLFVWALLAAVVLVAGYWLTPLLATLLITLLPLGAGSALLGSWAIFLCLVVLVLLTV